MPMTLQEISDRFEIADLLNAYCTAIDSKDIDALDNIFTPDACIDYTKAGGPRTDVPTVKKFLKENLGDLPRQHIISNMQFMLNGDTAQVRSLCINPLELPNDGGNLDVAIWGLWYNDTLIRTSNGWRITEKVTEPCYNWKFRRLNS